MTVRYVTAILTAIVSLAIATTAMAKEEKAAKAAAPAGPPKPGPEMDAVKVFLGHWMCEGKAPASAMGPEHPIKGEAHVQEGPNGFWHHFTYKHAMDKANPMPFNAMGLWGWDAATKQYWRAETDGFGGRNTATSKGWEGNKMVWTGEIAMMGKVTQLRHTFEKKSDKELMHRPEAMMDGKWVVMEETVCKKK